MLETENGQALAFERPEIGYAKGPPLPNGKGKGKTPPGIGKGGADPSNPKLPASAVSPSLLGNSLQEVLAARKAKIKGEFSNTDARRSIIRKEGGATLWLGNAEDAEDVDALKSDGITHILNCAREIAEPPHTAEFEYLHLDLDDCAEASSHLMEELRSGRALKFIDEGLGDHDQLPL